MSRPLATPVTAPADSPRVLIVEDDRLNARILTGILKPEGYEIADVGSGEAAMERYPQSKSGLVLLDVMMPGISG